MLYLWYVMGASSQDRNPRYGRGTQHLKSLRWNPTRKLYNRAKIVSITMATWLSSTEVVLRFQIPPQNNINTRRSKGNKRQPSRQTHLTQHDTTTIHDITTHKEEETRQYDKKYAWRRQHVITQTQRHKQNTRK